MNILVTGAAGFVGRNLVENLKNIKDGKNRTRPGINIGEIYEYDMDSSAEELDKWCADADFVFNLAGVNRPKDPSEFAGNYGFADELLKTLKKYGNKCPVMLSSSIQATLAGRFGKSEYGLSKKAGEDIIEESVESMNKRLGFRVGSRLQIVKVGMEDRDASDVKSGSILGGRLSQEIEEGHGVHFDNGAYSSRVEKVYRKWKTFYVETASGGTYEVVPVDAYK